MLAMRNGISSGGAGQRGLAHDAPMRGRLLVALLALAVAGTLAWWLTADDAAVASPEAAAAPTSLAGATPRPEA